MAPFGRDKGIEVVIVPVNPDMWHGINIPGGDPIAEVHRRGLDRLRMYEQTDEEEIEVIGSDPMYSESCRAEYWRAMKMLDKHRKLPRRLEIEYNRPGFVRQEE